MAQLFGNRRFLIIALIFLLITWMLFVTSHRRDGEGKMEYFLNTAMAPLESIFDYMGTMVADTSNTIIKLGQLRQENEKLRREINLLRTRQLGLDTLKTENERLRTALNFQSQHSYDLVSAEVIAINPSNWNQTITINQGRNVGLRRNMAVIAPQGIVGRVNAVRAHTAEVILLNDPREGNFIGGMVARTRTMVLITGGGYLRGQCTVKPAIDSYFIDLKKNDLILTSENSDIFPRGMPIGRITSIDKGTQQMVNQASLKPTVRLGKLQMVYVLK